MRCLNLDSCIKHQMEMPSHRDQNAAETRGVGESSVENIASIRGDYDFNKHEPSVRSQTMGAYLRVGRHHRYKGRIHSGRDRHPLALGSRKDRLRAQQVATEARRTSRVAGQR